MGSYYRISKRGGTVIPPLIILLTLLELLLTVQVKAQGGLAISGSFYRQGFEIPQGCSIESSDANVLVFNNGDSEILVKMSTESPAGVEITLSEYDFALEPKNQKNILIGIEVSQDAIPGEYKISVTAESYKKGTEGIQVTGAAGQSARLTILGESATVKVQATDPDGQPMVALVKLHKNLSGQLSEIARSDTGTLEAKVAPGSFVASLYAGEEKRADNYFEVLSGEVKTIRLSAATVLFEGFGALPAYHNKTGEIGFVQIVYTVRNVYKKINEDVEILLEVTRDGSPLETISLIKLNTLEMGRLGLNFNYIPGSGWTNGEYSFRLKLNIDGKVYASTLEEKITVNSIEENERKINPLVIAGIITGILLATGGGFFFFRRKKA